MLEFSIHSINWLAVLVASFAYFMFTGPWHSQFVFGKKWDEALGFERPENWKVTPIYYIVPFLGSLGVGITVAIFSQLLAVQNLSEALSLGLILGLGLATSLTFINAVTPTVKRPILLGLITGTAHAIGISLLSVILFAIG